MSEAKKKFVSPESDCIFCKIVKGEIPALVIDENEKCVAFFDAFPFSDGHALVVPKKHYRDLLHTPDDELAAVTAMAKRVAQLLSDSKLDPWGFNFVSNLGQIAGQSVFHFHMHVIPKYGAAEGYMQSVGVKHLRQVQEVVELVGKAAKKKRKRLI